MASEFCLRDYFRTRPAMTRDAIATLVETGELIPVTVQGWESKPHYLWHEARLPRRIDGPGAAQPVRLDDLRAGPAGAAVRLRATGSRSTCPSPKRVHGYYVYPFLLGEHFVARVDLKADRARGVLRVNSAWLEPGHDPALRRRRAGAELQRLAGWQGLSAVEVLPRGDLARTCPAERPQAWPRRVPNLAYDGWRACRDIRADRRMAVHVKVTTSVREPVSVALMDRLLRVGEGKLLKQLKGIANQVNAIEDDFVAMDDDELRGQTADFQSRLREGRDAGVAAARRRSPPYARPAGGCWTSGTSTSS